MKKYFNSFKGCVLMLLGMFVLASCESETWKEHYSTNQGGSGDVKTLAEELASLPNAKKFVETLKNTYIYDGDKQTVLTYWKMLDDTHSQFLTVWVPSDDADIPWDKYTAPLSDESKDHKKIGSEFILNHIAMFRHEVGPKTKEKGYPQGYEKIYMLSEKSFKSYADNIGGLRYADNGTNIRCANGLIHVLANGKYMDYRPSIYEYITTAPEYRDVLGAWFEKYTVEEIDPKKSIAGGVNKDGEVEYVDSVMVKRSVIMNNFKAFISEEDSNYAMVLPTPDVWTTMYDSAKQFYEYWETERGRDSLQDFYTKSALLTDMFFNMNDWVQKSPSDSVVSTLFSKNTRKENKIPYNVDYKPYDKQTGLFGACQDSIMLSNGVIYRWNTWPYEDSLTYRRTIRIEAEDAKLQSDQGFVLNRRYVSRINGVKLPKSIQVMEISANMKDWDAVYPIENNLKGWYEFKLVIAPQSTPALPNIFHPVVYYVDGSDKNLTLIDDKKKVGFAWKKTNFENDMTKLDTITIGRAEIPACNYKTTSSRLRLQISSAISGSLANDHTEKMLLDCILLEPIKKPIETTE